MPLTLGKGLGKNQGVGVGEMARDLSSSGGPEFNPQDPTWRLKIIYKEISHAGVDVDNIHTLNR